MKYTEANTEFSIRLYRWAKLAQENEIRGSFANFRLSKGWPMKTCRFFQSIDQHSQKILGHGVLQRRHQNAVKALNEEVSAEAQELMRREEVFRLNTSSSELASHAGSSENTPCLATRKQLKKAMTDHFRATFGDECLPPDPLDGSSDLRFRMKYCGWIIKTGFEFGRWAPEIRHQHSVWTGKWITKEEPEILPANCMGIGLNYGNEIGIGSGWEDIAVDDVEPTCVAVVQHCREMFDAFPKLLEGLDLELLTA